MAKMFNVNEVLNEKGNMKQPVRVGFKNQVVAKFVKEYGFELKENGKLAKVIAEVDNGDIITANVEITIGLNTDFSKREKATKSTKAKVEVPTLD